jgi:hypothetical protein
MSKGDVALVLNHYKMTLFKALQLFNAFYGGENTSKVFTFLLH